jgi:hypothetical protein
LDSVEREELKALTAIDVTKCKDPEHNAQLVYRHFKDNILQLAKAEGKQQANRMRTKSEKLETRIHKIENSPETMKDPEAMAAAALLKHKYEFLEHKRRQRQREDSHFKHNQGCQRLHNCMRPGESL